jgi:hypothetical protein
MGWNWNDLTVAAGASGGAGSVWSAQIDAYVFAAQGTQHVNFGAGSGYVVELWWDNSGWHYNPIAAALNAPMVGNNSSQTGYMFNTQGTQHVIYGGVDNHIHELWWESGGWQPNDLTNATGGVSGFSGSSGFPPNGIPYGYAFETLGTQHVVYNADDGHIIELWWENGGWNRNDLTMAAGVTVTLDSSPTGFAFEAQGTRHVNFRGVDGHIYQLWWDGLWMPQIDLTYAANAPPALTYATGADRFGTVQGPYGYVFAAQGTEHVIYVGQDYHIHELWYGGNLWQHNDLTNAAANAAAAPSVGDLSVPFGYVFESQGTQHVNYQGPDNHIHELWWDNSGWHYNDLTNAANAPSASFKPGGPIGYAFEAQGTQHVIYRADNFDAVELYWTP